MKEIRKETYNESGLVKVEFIEIDELTDEELLAEKEAELIRIYNEIQELKKISN